MANKRIVKKKGNESKSKVYVVTTYTPGLRVFGSALKSLRAYCNRRKAQLLILATNPYRQKLEDENEEVEFSPEIAIHHVVRGELALNKNISVRPVELNPLAANALTGFQRVGRNDQSLILPGNTIIRNDVASLGNSTHILQTTGSICLKPDGARKSDIVAQSDWTCAALVVEIQDEQYYFSRHIEFDKDGSFIDLGTRYLTSGQTQKERAEAFYLGDIHAGEHDKTALDATLALAKEVGAKQFVTGDLISGYTVSPHELENKEAQYRRFLAGQDDFSAEMKIAAGVIDQITSIAPLILQQGNHEGWIQRWLNAPETLIPVRNWAAWKQLKAHSGNVIEHALRVFGGLKTNKIKFLECDQSFKVQDCELGLHGDIGAGGCRKPSVAHLEKTFRSSVHGHFHSASILRKTWVAGCLMALKPDYAKGASSWSHTSVIVYRGRRGSVLRQMITVVNGKTHLSSKQIQLQTTALKKAG